jgi:hypothetical protein
MQAIASGANQQPNNNKLSGEKLADQAERRKP